MKSTCGQRHRRDIMGKTTKGSHSVARRAAAIIAAWLTLTVSLSFAQESTIKENAKEAGRAVGTGVREVAKGAKQVGAAASEAAKEVVEAAKEGGKELKRAVKGAKE